jgi:hypothetical protein
MSLSDFFQSSETTAPTHSWTLVCHDPATLPVDTLARDLADRIIQHRCRGCPHHYQAWRQHVDGGPSPSGASKDALEAFIKPVFGLPGNPDAVPQDHLEGFVAQYLWYFLTRETPTEDTVVRVEPPGFEAIDHGGDGLVIHRVPIGYLMFRLWEIKKCVGASVVSSTVSTAYSQLDAKAKEYLARYTAIGQELQNEPELADFYGQLIDLWVDAQPGAAVGVSVATSSDHIPQECFTTFGQRFPKFVDPVRLRGMLTAIGDFSDFACRVRDSVWIGL